jgi:hypothetical protein
VSQLPRTQAARIQPSLRFDLFKTDFEKALHRQTWGPIGVILAQAAFVIAVLQFLR